MSRQRALELCVDADRNIIAGLPSESILCAAIRELCKEPEGDKRELVEKVLKSYLIHDITTIREAVDGIMEVFK